MLHIIVNKKQNVIFVHKKTALFYHFSERKMDI